MQKIKLGNQFLCQTDIMFEKKRKFYFLLKVRKSITISKPNLSLKFIIFEKSRLQNETFQTHSLFFDGLKSIFYDETVSYSKPSARTEQDLFLSQLIVPLQSLKEGNKNLLPVVHQNEINLLKKKEIHA